MQKILGLLYSLLSSENKNNLICHFQFATESLVVFVPVLVLVLLGVHVLIMESDSRNSLSDLSLLHLKKTKTVVYGGGRVLQCKKKASLTST